MDESKHAHEAIPAISCVILAGGRGRRAGGRDKGLIELDGEPLIVHVVRRLTGQVHEIVISANRNLEAYRQFSSRVVPDRHSDYAGPLAGIAAGLEVCTHPWVLVVACDMPFLPADLVQRLWNARQRELSVAQVNGRKQLALLMHRELRDQVQSALDAGRPRLMDLLDRDEIGSADFSQQESCFINLNQGAW